MEAYINNFIEIVKSVITTYPPILGLFLGIFIVFIESIIPVLPLSAFVAINVIVFGNIIGIIISYIGTIIGCLTSFTLFRKVISKKLKKRMQKNKKIQNLMDKISHFNFSTLVILMAFPFTPAFSINIACGLSEMSYKKFFIACLIGKLPMIYFWGYIGMTFVESLTNPYALINIIAIVLLSYIVSKIFMCKFKI